MESEDRSEHGFMLLDIMIAIAIIGLIASAIGVAAFKKYQEGQNATARMQVRDLLANVTQFTITKGKCPTMEELVADGYVRRLPVDPWGAAIELRCPSEHEGDAADVISSGRDKKRDTPDDVRSWDP